MINSSKFEKISEADFTIYDTVVFSVGTEHRSVQIFKEMKGSGVRAAAYIHNENSFTEEKAGKRIIGRQIDFEILNGTLYSNGQHEQYREFLEGSSKVLVDVSCMSRTMMCEQVLYLSEFRDAGVEIHFAYLPTVFSEPVHEYPKIRKIGAAAPQFSGFDFRPGDPIALVLGLGHEFGVSIGLLNQMEPRMAVAFRSIGIDRRFEKAVMDANFGFDFTPYAATVLDIDITRPKEGFMAIETVFSNIITDHRLIVIPSGPKLFALLCILAAFKHLGKVAIFRVEHARNFGVGVESESIIRLSMDETFTAKVVESEWLAP